MANPASQHAIQLETHRARVVAYAMALLLALASEWSRSRAPGFWIWIVLLTTLWPQIAYARVRRARDKRTAELSNELGDALAGGCFGAALGFALWPTVGVLIPIFVAIFRAGGAAYLVRALATAVIGALAGAAIFGVSFRPESSLLTAALAIALLVGFTLNFAAVARWQGGALRQGKRALDVALEQQAATSQVLRAITTGRVDLEQVFYTIIKSAVRLCGGVVGGVFRYDGELLHLVAHEHYNPEALAAVQRAFPLRPTRESVTARAIVERAVVHVIDMEEEPGPNQRTLSRLLGFRSMIAAPMMRDGEPIGVIAVGRREVGGFSTTDVALLKMFCEQAAVALENVRLVNELEEKKSQLERELASARRIQLSMVPTDFPTPGPDMPVELHAALLPARQVGGDLYDFFWLDPQSLYVVVADVSDKGAPAALFMARAKTLIRLIATVLPGADGRPAPPHAIIARVNQELCQDNPFGMFVTLFVGLLRPASGELTFCNAGHPVPYVLRPHGNVIPLIGAQAKPVGVTPRVTYASTTTHLATGECLFLFTDGIPESTDRAGAFYEDARLEETLRSLAGRTPREVVAGVVESVRRFCGDAPPADDIAVIALRRARAAVVELTVTNRPGDFDQVVHAVDEFGAIHGMPRDVVADVNVALDEVLTNIVMYGYRDEAVHEIRVRLEASPDRVEIDVEDDGIAFDPATAPVTPPHGGSVRERTAGGLGLHFVHHLVDDVSYARVGERNRLHLRKALRPRRAV